MKFHTVAHYFSKIEKTSSRLEITALLAHLFDECSPEEISYLLYLVQGRVAPQYESVDFGLGETLVIQAMTRIVLGEDGQFEQRVKREGDIGIAIEQVLPNRDSTLTLKEVFTTLHEITQKSGAGSQDDKLELLSQLVQVADPISARYIVRIPVGKLRLGCSDMTLLDSLSWMLVGDKSLRKQIEQAYHVLPEIGYIGQVLKKDGIKGIAHIQPRVGTPILMMRAERASSGEEIIRKIGEGLIENKYDGFRLQIHVTGVGEKKRVYLYSRGLENMTAMYPDIVAAVRELDVTDAIFEGEAIGFNPTTGEQLPFQETVQRKRKYGIEDIIKTIPLKVYCFDLLHINTRSVIREPLTVRREELEKMLRDCIPSTKTHLILSPAQLCSDAVAIEDAFDTAIEQGLEGIMAKRLDAPYHPGARESSWIKYKKSYSSKIQDTVDCVLMGYDSGKGKRSSFGIGALLIGVYDSEADMYRTVSKLGTGLTDDEWRYIKEKGDALQSQTKPKRFDVDPSMYVDVWVNEGVILEIKADEITRSSMHTAGRRMKASKSGKGTQVDSAGYALRFPRLERFRTDKRPEDTTTVSEIIGMFTSQNSS